MTRPLSVARRPRAKGPFETVMAVASRNPGSLGYIARRKLKRRQCTRMQDTFSEVLAQTRPGVLCIDLGANISTMTRWMAETGADVVSFEPDPAAFAALRKAMRDAPNVELVNHAAGVEAGILLLYRSARWSADDPVNHTEGSSLIAEQGNEAHAVEVEVIDIVGYLDALDRDIPLVKMDIEGAEWAIMERLMDHPVLNRIDCIFVETHERSDPARYVPLFNALQGRTEQIQRPYINLYWV